MRQAPKRPHIGTGDISAKVLAALPFRLTGAQEGAIAEIRADMAAPDRMLRLLQGDVGSGKTVVALMVAATAIEAGGQVALMAPTELLARQHFRSLEPHARASGLEIAILTGREKGRERRRRGWKALPPAASISSSAPTRSSRRPSSFMT